MAGASAMKKDRACLRCARPASWTVAHGQTYEGIPSGLEYSYRCSSCGAQFSVLGNGLFFWSFAGIAGFLWFASTFIWHDGEPRWSTFGCVLIACTVAVLGQTVYRLRVRLLTSPSRIGHNGVVVR